MDSTAAVSKALHATFGPVLGARMPRSAYVRVASLHVTAYVRMATRRVPRQTASASYEFVLDVANVAVDEGFGGRGNFKAFLRGIEAVAREQGCAAVRVECVHDERLLAFLTRSPSSGGAGYTAAEDEGKTVWKVLADAAEWRKIEGAAAEAASDEGTA
jgi:hypothetical protein